MNPVIIGNATIYLGDCMDILPTLKDHSINWCVTSPPYNLHKEHHTSPGATTAANAAMTAKYADWYDDDMNETEYQEQQKIIVAELLRICTDSVFYNHRIRYAWHARNKNAPACKAYHPMHWLSEFPIWCEIIWDRCGGSTPTGRYQQGHELIYQIGKPRRVQKSLGMLDVWRIPADSGSGHVCAFPLRLVDNCLRPHAIAGESVIDPYMGSGTVGEMACILGLPFIGIESDRNNFQLACGRIEKAYKQGQLFVPEPQKQVQDSLL
jgi:DNA modification methylase